ncbi:hypothetical protein GCM10028817_21850 [Spirosoma pomorum]
MTEQKLEKQINKLMLSGKHTDRTEAKRIREQLKKLRSQNKQRSNQINNQTPTLF